MISSDQQIDLVINRIKRAQYEKLQLSSLVDDSQLYLITDDPTVDQQIEGHLSDYYKTSETSSASEISSAIQNADNALSGYVKLSSDVQQKISSDMQIDGYVKVGNLQVTQGHYYPLFNVTTELHDRAIDIIDENTVWQVDPDTGVKYLTLPDDFTDLLIRVDVQEGDSMNISAPEHITTTFGDAFPSSVGSYIVTMTKISQTEMLVKTLKLEVAA